VEKYLNSLYNQCGGAANMIEWFPNALEKLGVFLEILNVFNGLEIMNVFRRLGILIIGDYERWRF
jgi:hypothetical protein